MTNKQDEGLLIEEIGEILWEVLSTAITIEIRKSPKAEVDRYITETSHQILAKAKPLIEKAVRERIYYAGFERCPHGKTLRTCNKCWQALKSS